MDNKLEKELGEQILDIKNKLVNVTGKINDYDNSNSIIDDKHYHGLINTRDNLKITLNYFQNQMIIEQNKDIIKYLKELKK